MALIQSIWLPRRGKKSTMNTTKKGQILARGEAFMEYPDTGVGTGHGKIKMGDGTTDYEHLPYFAGDTENEKIAFSSNTSTTVAAALNAVVSGASLKNIIAGLKQAIVQNDTNVTKLNDELREAFQDGCKKIVDGLTAMDVVIEDPQGPDEIITGVKDLIQDIKDNPEKYGIKTGLDYSSDVSSKTYNGIGVRSWGTGNSGDPSLDVSDSKSYNIPLQNGNGQSLYGINISISASNETASSASASFSLKTVEGATIYSDSVSSSGRVTKTKTTFCDLLAKTFNTSKNYLILNMSASAHTSSSSSGYCQSGYANVSDASARYK